MTTLFSVGQGAGLALVASFAVAALWVYSRPKIRGFSFTLWILFFSSFAFYYPSAFRQWGSFELKLLIVPLVQLIMFSIGTTLSVRDFARVLSMPWPLLIGLTLQFGVMPITGFLLAKAFGFQGELAAGIVLIGSCSCGVASNLMTYLAGGNVALSVTMTACSTILAPLVTPLFMEMLAGQFVSIDFLDMMLGIINIVVVPIAAGLAANAVLYGKHRWTRSRMLEATQHWANRILPLISMIAICVILAIIMAQTRDMLLEVGISLIAVAVLHNTIGYLLGYWLARAVRLDEIACRTIAIEVGLQNGGMATGLAINVLHSHAAALPANVFGTWMNISASLLAKWWHHHPPTLSETPRKGKGPTDDK
jgi:bile acid:Na+ symporter, BASS family